MKALTLAWDKVLLQNLGRAAQRDIVTRISFQALSASQKQALFVDAFVTLILTPAGGFFQHGILSLLKLVTPAGGWFR